jgi:hypothetical protein
MERVRRARSTFAGQGQSAGALARVSPQWLRYGDGETAPARALRQEAAAYRADPAWVSKKYEALNDSHKKMVAELVVALLRLEGKR